MVVLVWSGSCTVRPRRSDVNKQMDLVFYLFLTGVREVAEPSDTSTPNELGQVGRHTTLHRKVHGGMPLAHSH